MFSSKKLKKGNSNSCTSTTSEHMNPWLTAGLASQKINCFCCLPAVGSWSWKQEISELRSLTELRSCSTSRDKASFSLLRSFTWSAPLAKSAALLILTLGVWAKDGISARRYSNPFLMEHFLLSSAVETLVSSDASDWEEPKNILH